jgi:hypothetical protein
MNYRHEISDLARVVCWLVEPQAISEFLATSLLIIFDRASRRVRPSGGSKLALVMGAFLVRVLLICVSIGFCFLIYFVFPCLLLFF